MSSTVDVSLVLFDHNILGQSSESWLTVLTAIAM